MWWTPLGLMDATQPMTSYSCEKSSSCMSFFNMFCDSPLLRYDPELPKRPSIILANKMDLEAATSNLPLLNEIADSFKDEGLLAVYPVSLTIDLTSSC